MEDKRANWKECELCDNPDFLPGTVCGMADHAGEASHRLFSRNDGAAEMTGEG